MNRKDPKGSENIGKSAKGPERTRKILSSPFGFFRVLSNPFGFCRFFADPFEYVRILSGAFGYFSILSSPEKTRKDQKEAERNQKDPIALGRNGQIEPSVSADFPMRWHAVGSPYGSRCVGQSDLASWAQTLMPLHPVRARFHILSSGCGKDNTGGPLF